MLGLRKSTVFFTSKRKKIAREVLDHVRPLFRMAEITAGHQPTQFVNDPYILGFVVGSAGFLARAAVDNSLSSSDLGFVTTDVIEGLFGKPGMSSMQQAMSLMKQGQNPEFQRGIANGQKTVLVGLGAAGELTADPDVKAATAANPDTSPSAAAAILQQRLFYDYVLTKCDGD
jgi:hypothetical protein